MWMRRSPRRRATSRIARVHGAEPRGGLHDHRRRGARASGDDALDHRSSCCRCARWSQAARVRARSNDRLTPAGSAGRHLPRGDRRRRIGLATAIHLARAGYGVTVLKQRDAPGEKGPPAGPRRLPLRHGADDPHHAVRARRAVRRGRPRPPRLPRASSAAPVLPRAFPDGLVFELSSSIGATCSYRCAPCRPTTSRATSIPTSRVRRIWHEVRRTRPPVPLLARPRRSGAARRGLQDGRADVAVEARRGASDPVPPSTADLSGDLRRRVAGRGRPAR